MLTIHIPEEELYDSERNLFYLSKPETLRLEHSLISMSKWESIFEKPFIPAYNTVDKTEVELITYIKCMVIGDVSDISVSVLWYKHRKTITNYIEKSHTATTIFRSKTVSGKRQTVTTELIYYWMIQYNIPFECQRWHINRLLTLIEVCNVKDSNEKKMSKQEILARNRAINNQRRAKIGSKG